MCAFFVELGEIFNDILQKCSLSHPEQFRSGLTEQFHLTKYWYVVVPPLSPPLASSSVVRAFTYGMGDSGLTYQKSAWCLRQRTPIVGSVVRTWSR